MPFTLVEGENALSVKINSAGKLKFVDVRLKFDEEKLPSTVLHPGHCGDAPSTKV